MATADKVAIADYFTPADSHASVIIHPTSMGPRVRLNDNSTMDPQHVENLPLELPPAATEINVFAALKNSSLISVGQICDDGCQAIFKKITSSLG